MTQGISLNEIFALATCFVGSAFFSGAEAVLMSIGTDRAKQLIEEGGARGKALAFMIEKPNELLTTILLGNNLANILAASLMTTITHRFFADGAVSISSGITTFIILIFGEIFPKTFARNRAEIFSTYVIRILQVIYYALYPGVVAVSFIINRVLGQNGHARGRIVTKNDLEYMINKAEKEQSMDSKHLELISSVLEFPTIKVKDIMIIRNKVKFVTNDVDFNGLMKLAKEDEYSRYPVCDGDLDSTLGLLLIKDLAFLSEQEKKEFKVEKYLKEPFFVYEHMKIQSVFDHMNRKKVHLALVKDENGLVVGVISLEDIVEELVGDIVDEYDLDAEEEVPVEGDLVEGLVVSADMSLRELYNEYDLKIPLNDNYSTLAGFILDVLGDTFPKKGQIIFWEDYTFELSQVEDYTIKEVIIKERKVSDEESDGDDGPEKGLRESDSDPDFDDANHFQSKSGTVNTEVRKGHRSNLTHLSRTVSSFLSFFL